MNETDAAPHILVVEDEPEMRQVLADMLVRPGWEVTPAADGVEALELLAARRPDVVLTDLNMPRMDGMELLQRINEEYPGLPVVVLTAYGSVPGAVEAMRCGAFDFLSKPPPGPRQLREVIRRALAASDRGRRSAREASPRWTWCTRTRPWPRPSAWPGPWRPGPPRC